MTFLRWARGLARRAKTAPTRPRLSIEPLEPRDVPSYGLGSAFGVGGEASDAGVAIAAHPAGNVAVAGNFQSAALDLDPTAGTYALSNAGGADAFVARYGPTGNLLWGVHLASAEHNFVQDVAVDGAGNVLVAGDFAGSVAIGAPGATAVMLTNGGARQGFLAKIDAAGSVLWVTTLGTASAPRLAHGITTDAAGNVYATGSEGHRLFVSKFGSDGAATWTSIVSGGTGVVWASGVTSFALGADVAVDAAGSVYVVGTYAGRVDFNPDSKKSNLLTSAGTSSDPSYDAFVLKLSATGAYVWSGGMGGRGIDGGSNVAVDGGGNVYVNGYAGVDPEGDFDPGRGRLSLSGGGFVVKFDPNRNLLWGTSGVGNGGLAVDATGAVYTTGGFSGTFDADPGAGVFNLTTTGARAVFVTKLDGAGHFVWAGAFGGPGYHQSNALAVDAGGNVYVTGAFRGMADFDPTNGLYLLDSTADADGDPTSDLFVVKLTPGG